MEKYGKLPETATIANMKKEDQVKIKGYMKEIGVPPQTKRFKALREKL
jgi:hypothetical protein